MTYISLESILPMKNIGVHLADNLSTSNKLPQVYIYVPPICGELSDQFLSNSAIGYVTENYTLHATKNCHKRISVKDWSLHL